MSEHRIWVLIIVILAIVAALAVAAGVYSVAYFVNPPPPSLEYSGYDYPGEVCLGEDLHGYIYGIARREPSYTLIGHDIYDAGTLNIALRLPQLAPVVYAVGNGAEEFFSFEYTIPSAGLAVGMYEYHRLSVQLPDTREAEIIIPFEVIECGS